MSASEDSVRPPQEVQRETPSLPRPFRLERYFSLYEFSAPHLLCCSDCESLSMAELVERSCTTSKKLWESLRLGYTESRGLPALREAVSKRFYKTVSADDVLLGAPEELIYISMRTMLKPSDTVIVMYPGYQSLSEIARSIGCRLLYWKMKEDAEGNLLFDLEDLRELVREARCGSRAASEEEGEEAEQAERGGRGGVGEENAKKRRRVSETSLRAIVVNFPHNPSGCTLSPEEWRKLVDIAAEAGAVLFSDEMYRGLELAPEGEQEGRGEAKKASDGETPASSINPSSSTATTTSTTTNATTSSSSSTTTYPSSSSSSYSSVLSAPYSLPAACDLGSHCVSLCGVSKQLSLPGLRIGWLASRDQTFVSACSEYKDYVSICSSAPSELLALMAVERMDEIVSKNRAIVQDNKNAVEQVMKETGDVLYWGSRGPAAGSIGLVRLNKLVGPWLGNAEGFCEDLLRAKGVLLLPGKVYREEAAEAEHFSSRTNEEGQKPTCSAVDLSCTMRLGLGRTNTKESLALLKEFLMEHSESRESSVNGRS